ncbi:MAG: hypothetical protein KIT34_02470 [Cyanobacteria bacterium TGS_CYA1]|nr:hypothetical protein [Cyanobacteria bacterium TGS_CYA1]
MDNFFRALIKNLDPDSSSKHLVISELGRRSKDRDGRYREAALRELMSCYDGTELHYILLRLNDWVPQIHELAMHAIESRLKLDYGMHFLSELELLPGLWRSTRYDFSLLRQNIEERITQVESSNGLRIKLDSPKRDVRLYAYQLWLLKNKLEALAVCVNAKDTEIRTMAVQEALPALNETEVRTYLDKWIHNKVSSVRLTTLKWLLAKSSFEDKLVFARKALFDQTRAVRTCARTAFGESEWKDIYLKELELESNAYPSLSALCETATKLSFTTLEPFLHSESGKVRAAAYALLFKNLVLDLPQDYTLERYVALAFLDHSGRCSREAKKVLQKNPRLLTLDYLWTVVANPTSPRARATAHAVIARNSKWASLPYLLKALSIQDPHFEKTARDAINQWFIDSNKSGIAASDQEKDACLEGLKEHGHQLRNSLRNELLFCIEKSQF